MFHVYVSKNFKFQTYNKNYILLSKLLSNVELDLRNNYQQVSKIENNFQLKSNLINTSAATSDFLTIQELFDELKLDCDESLRKLDHLEHQRKEAETTQRRILDQIQWQVELKKTIKNRRCDESFLRSKMKKNAILRVCNKKLSKRRKVQSNRLLRFKLFLKKQLVNFQICRNFGFSLNLIDLSSYFSNFHMVKLLVKNTIASFKTINGHQLTK